MDAKDILRICKDSNVTLKSTYKGPERSVDVVCNECGIRFPVAMCKSSVIKCTCCVDEEIVKIKTQEPVEKTPSKRKKKRIV